MEGPPGARAHLRTAPLDALPDAAFELIAARLPRDDLCALRTACSAAHTAADKHCATTVRVSLLPGEARPADLPGRVARCPNASTLRFITYKGLSPRLAWEHEQAVAELQQCLDQTPQGLLSCAAERDARLRQVAQAAEHVRISQHASSSLLLPLQPPPTALPSAGSPCWPRIRRIVDCPAACVQSLAELCPNAEAFSTCAIATGGVSRAAFQALGRLSALTQLSIAGPRRAYGGGHTWRVGLDKGVWGMIAAMPSLRSLILDCRPPVWDVGPMASLPPEACASLRSATAVTGLVCLELGDSKLVRPEDALPALIASNLAALTSLELGVKSLSYTVGFGVNGFGHVGPRQWLARMTALVRLSLPCADLGNEGLEAIAATAPQLTSLCAQRLCATETGGAQLTHLVELAGRVSPWLKLDLGEFAPALRVLELEGLYDPASRGSDGELDDRLLCHTSQPLRVVLAAGLERGAGAFDMLRSGRLEGVDLRGPLDAPWSPSRGKAADEAARQAQMEVFTTFCVALDDALRFGERALSLRAERDMLAFVLLAAAHAPRIGALRLEFVSKCGPPEDDEDAAGTYAERHQQVEECIAAAMCFRQLGSLELVFAPWGPTTESGMTDAHLEQIARSRPRSLTRVVLRNARHVTPACAAAVMRRALGQGQAPLEVTLAYGDVGP